MSFKLDASENLGRGNESDVFHILIGLSSRRARETTKKRDDRVAPVVIDASVKP